MQNYFQIGMGGLNSLSDDKILPLSKLKASADNNFNVAKMVHFFCDGEANIVGIEENAIHQDFLLFTHYFHKKPGFIG